MTVSQDASKLLWRYVRWLASRPTSGQPLQHVRSHHAGQCHHSSSLLMSHQLQQGASGLQGSCAHHLASRQTPVHQRNTSWLPAAAHSHLTTIRSFTSTSTPPSADAGQEGSNSVEGKQELAKIVPRLAMVFTCVKCDTRSVKTFSRSSYEMGLVMVRCPGCNKNHLVADHLGWFGEKGWTVEQLTAERGTRVRVVSPGAPSDATSVENLSLGVEDWVGWSKVEQLLAMAHQQQQQQKQASHEEGVGAGGQAGSGSGASGATDVPPDADAAAQAQEQAGVWEVAPQDLEHWRRVKQGA